MMKTNLIIEYDNVKYDSKTIIDTFKEIWKNKGNKVKDLKNVEIYFKPEEKTCYYVTEDGKEKGNFTI